MTRKEKNALMKRAADAIDAALVGTRMQPQQAAGMIGILREIDEGLCITHSDRGYHASIAQGHILLEHDIEH